MFQRNIGQYNDGYNMMWGGGWGWGFLMMLLGTILVAAAVIWVLRATQRHDNIGRGNDALEIIKKRYASGEIDKSQYDQLREDLK